MSEAEVREILVNIVENLKGNKKSFKKWNKPVSFEFTDLEKVFHVNIVNGLCSDLQEGEPTGKGPRMIVDTATFIGVNDGKINPMSAMRSGKFKLKASMREMMKLQSVMGKIERKPTRPRVKLSEADRQARRKELEKQFLKGKIPYAMDDDIEQFESKNMCMSRMLWDPTFSSYQKSMFDAASKKWNKPGYSPLDFAAQSAAWTIQTGYLGILDWESALPEFADIMAVMMNLGGGGAPAAEVMDGVMAGMDSELMDQELSPEDLTDPIKLMEKFMSGEKGEKMNPAGVGHFIPKYESTDLQHNADIVKRVAIVNGACDVGICKLDNYEFLYSDNMMGAKITYPKGIKYAIVMLIEMDYDCIKSSPQIPASMAVGNGYSRMAFTGSSVAEFIRNLGYKAIPADNWVGLSVPLAIKAGLGQLGRNGLLITPKYGQRIRIVKVLTDFPMKVDKPINFGVTEFCKVCKKCAKHCPSQAISYDKMPIWEPNYRAKTDLDYNYKSNHSGVYKWYVDVEKCYEQWVRNGADCSNCIRACPFTKPTDGVFVFSHGIARFFIKHFRFLDRSMVLLDDVMAKFPFWGYGEKAKNIDELWQSRKWLGRKY